ncbi:MAG: class I SAM-dependent methyltransferase [Firmicutes bacterium]|nr:class I SAM-dependent methyltransferase [Bacillota bacterium]
MKAFDKVYGHYDAFMKLFNLYKIEEIRTVLNLQGYEILADIGGGTGCLAASLSDHCQKIYVLDESERMLSKVKTNEKIIPVPGDALHMPFEDGSMDIVILSDVLHHLEEQQALIAEIHRILKRKGKMLILDFDKRYIKTKLLRFFEYLLFGKLYFRTSREVKDLCKDKFVMHTFIDKQYYFMILGEKND